MADIKVSLQVLLEGNGIQNTTNALAGLASQASQKFGSSKASTEQLIAAFGKLDASINKIGDSLNKVPKNIPNIPKPPTPEIEKFTSAQKSANQSVMEFSRVIQDAPFGIRGVANNITQLTQVMANTATKAGGMGTALKLAFSSMLTPMNLVVIGMSVFTSAMVWMGDRAQKTAKQVKEQKDVFEEYVKTLNDVQAASLKGQADAQKDIARAGTLFSAITNVNVSLTNRKDAIKAIQLEFPSYFKNLTEEEILSGKGKLAYDNLTKSLIATAKARAYENKIAENSIKMLVIEGKAMEANKRLSDAVEASKKSKPTELVQGVPVLSLDENAGSHLYKMRKAQEEISALTKEINVLNADNLSLETEINKQLEFGSQHLKTTVSEGRKAKEEIVGLAGSMKLLNDTKSKIESKLELAVDSSEVERLSKKLVDINLEIFKLTSKQHQIQMKVAFDRFGIPKIGDIESEALNAIDLSVKPFEKTSAEAKYYKKVIADRYKEEEKIAKEWLKQKDSIDKKYDKDKLRQAKEFNRVLSNGLASAGQSLLQSISTVNELKDQDFKTIFNHIGSGLIGMFDNLFANVLSEKIKNSLVKNLEEGGESVLKSLDTGANRILAASAGLSVLGTLIGGVLPKTSIVGQGLGGAFKGAGTGLAAGAAIGSGGGPVGALIGAGVGAIVGIFGAIKARNKKKEEEKILAENKKQTALMERQNAMTFLSSIVGRMVDGVGVINNADISWDGKLITKVSGTDLQFILDRNKNNKKT